MNNTITNWTQEGLPDFIPDVAGTWPVRPREEDKV